MRDRSRQFRASVLSLSFREVRRSPLWSFKTSGPGGDPFGPPFPRVVGSFGHLGRGPKSNPTASTSGICATLEGRRPSGLKGFKDLFAACPLWRFPFSLYGFLPLALDPPPGGPPSCALSFHPGDHDETRGFRVFGEEDGGETLSGPPNHFDLSSACLSPVRGSAIPGSGTSPRKPPCGNPHRKFGIFQLPC